MLPRHVHAVKWKSGRIAYYWHPHRGTAKAQPPVRLPDDPASSEFWTAVRGLQQGQKPAAGMVRMIDAYQASPHYTGLAEATRREYDRYMGTLKVEMREFDPDDLLPEHIAGFRDAMGETPAKANAYIRAIAALYKWGRERGFARHNPADGITKLKIGAHKPWPQWAYDAAVTHFREEIRLACQLGHYTGQRLGDVLNMRLGDIGADGIHVVQGKTKKEVTIPIHRELKPVIAECRRRGKMFLVSRDDGSAYTVDQFHAMWGREMKHPELAKIRAAGLSFHGLRKKFAGDAAEAGLSGSEIGALTGQTLPVVEFYAKGADQKRLAKTGMRKLEGRTE